MVFLVLMTNFNSSHASIVHIDYGSFMLISGQYIIWNIFKKNKVKNHLDKIGIYHVWDVLILLCLKSFFLESIMLTGVSDMTVLCCFCNSGVEQIADALSLCALKSHCKCVRYLWSSSEFWNHKMDFSNWEMPGCVYGDVLFDLTLARWYSDISRLST